MKEIDGMTGKKASSNSADLNWFNSPSQESETVKQQYDEFAPDYDIVLIEEWGYRAPSEAADLISEVLPGNAKILDAGCGTGITGKALYDAGFRQIHGVDISEASLEIAKASGVYTALLPCDLQKPLPFEDDSFDAAQCIGVLTYIKGDGVLREFIRIVRPGGYICFTQRSDLNESLKFEQTLTRMEKDGLWRRIRKSSPQPYLPGNPDFGDKIKVIYFLYQVSES